MNWCWATKLFGHKYLEVQLMFNSEWQFFVCWFALTHRQDHAGFKFDIEILGLNFCFNIYDHRHWDYETKSWNKETPPPHSPEDLD